MGARVEVVGAERLEDLGELQASAEAIFGRGRRRPDWFRRKLAREGVDAQLSAIARSGEGSGDRWTILGYALLGRSPSLGAVARGAGVGVVSEAQGSGLGRALLDLVSARAREAGFVAIEFLTEPERLGWYLAQGFTVIEEQLTLIAPGLGPWPAPCGLPEGSGGSGGRGSEVLWSWLPEIWERTPAKERARIEFESGVKRVGVKAWLTREGQAWLVHRVELSPSEPEPDVVHELAMDLRRRVPRATPLLLYPCVADSIWIEALHGASFELAQRSFIVRRPTSSMT